MAKDENTHYPGDEKPGASMSEALTRMTSVDTKKSKLPIGARLRNYFLTGLIIVGPVGITLYVFWWFVNQVDAWVKPLVPTAYLPETYLPFTVPGVGLIFSIVVLMVVGALTANLFGRTLVSYGEMILGRMPFVRGVYRALKQIFDTVLSQSNNSFQQVGLVEYPRRGIYAIVFVSTPTTGEVDHKVLKGEPILSVFLPTTPNPTSGYLLFVPETDVIILDMSVEEGAKLVISAGLVVPAYQAKLKKYARAAKSKPLKKPPQKAREKTPA